MAKHFTATLLFAAAIVIAGCKSEYRLNESMLEHIQSTDVIVVVDQHEINAQISRSNVAMFAGGGLIPALIDVASRTHRPKTPRSWLPRFATA
jgi:type III secretory pathway lipoprotein EscJ